MIISLFWGDSFDATAECVVNPVALENHCCDKNGVPFSNDYFYENDFLFIFFPSIFFQSTNRIGLYFRWLLSAGGGMSLTSPMSMRSFEYFPGNELGLGRKRSFGLWNHTNSIRHV